MRNVFCPKCHKLAVQLKQDNGTTKVVQNGHVILSMGSGTMNSVSISCPAGHSVPLRFHLDASWVTTQCPAAKVGDLA